jgi:signal transduction histidine kinase
LEVTNRGKAIDPADMKRIFEPLERGKSSHSTEGSGLGLFITRELVTAHGGEISVRSDADATVFSVRLPREEVAD